MPYFNNNDDAYRLFSKDISSKADEEINRLRTEISENTEKSIKRIETELHARVFRSLEIDLNDLNAEFSANLSKVKNEYTRVLMKKRRDLLDSIVEEARIKSVEFVNSPDYKKFLDAKISNVNERFCKQTVEFRVKKGDKIAIETIKNSFDGKYEIKEINEIEIGGFSVICFQMGVMLDETIDARLREKQLWFYEHSDLAAK
jgi:vacuolar-type H+-ATPase subunit E/Vma4